MKKEMVIPAIELKDIENIKTFRYLKGYPLVYKFDARVGRFVQGVDDESAVEIGKELKIIPIAYRVFTAALFGKKENRWAELFFVNKAGSIGNILFHGFSVSNLERFFAQEVFYSGHEMNEIILIVKPAKKEGKDGNGNQTTFYVANFSFQPAPEKYLERLAEIGFPEIYREETFKPDQFTLIDFNMTLPERQEQGALSDGEAGE